MDSNATLINLEFGTKQLSGNLALYKKLLSRFAADYEHTSEKLAEFAQLNNLEEMQLLVHTIKGVSGNLGLDRLHYHSTNLDRSLKTDNIDASLISVLDQSMTETLSEVNKLCDNSPNAASENRTKASKQQFIDELRKQRFISDDRLAEFVEASGLPSGQQQQVKDAIDQLDYNAALELLENN